MILLACFLALFASITKEEAAKARLEEVETYGTFFERVGLFYELKEGEDLKEVTADVLASSDTTDPVKEAIRNSNRRIFVFSYPCDGLKIKGYISFVPNPEGNPLLYMLRGGNEFFGLMNPANRYSVMGNYTVIASAQRGSVSEGKDEFGGADVNDIAALFDFFPTLEEKLNIAFQPKSVYALGGSRGGMQLFLALARYPHIQQQVNKIVSNSGLLDIEELIRARDDMRDMFINRFGLVYGLNDEEWIAHRNPILTVPFIRKDLPILIIQGTKDVRVTLPEGLHMLEKLRENGNCVDYWEIEGGDHCINNPDGILQKVANWLEANDLKK